MCDIEYPGMYMSFLNSFSTLGKVWVKTFWLILFDYLDFDFLIMVGFTYNLIYFYAWKN